MFSIPKLLGNENLFFGLLETFALARRRNKEITRQIHNVGYDTLGITTSIQAVGAGGINGLEKVVQLF